MPCPRPPARTPASGSTPPAVPSTRPCGPPGRPRGRARRAGAGRGAGRRHRCPGTASPRGARHPLTTHPGPVADIFVGDGLRGRRGPRARGGVAQLRRAEHRAGPPGAHDDGHVLRRPPEDRAGAAHAHLAGAGPHDARPQAADLRRRAGPGLPHRRARRDAHPGLPPGRGPGRRRGHHHGAPARHAGPLRRAMFGAEPVDPAAALTTSRSPSRGPSSTSVLRCRGESVGNPDRPCRTCSSGAGSSGVAAAWSTRGCSPPAASTPRLHRLRVRHGHRADAACSATASTTCATSSRATSGSPVRSEWSLMRVPCRWLREHVDLPARSAASRSPTRLSGPGLEVEEVEPLGAESPARSSSAGCWSSRGAAEVQRSRSAAARSTSARAIPRGIVCGARNFAVGDLVVVALPGRRAARATSRSPPGRPTATSPTG